MEWSNLTQAEHKATFLATDKKPPLPLPNKTLTAFHERRKEDIEAGKRPTVRESLERLSS